MRTRATTTAITIAAALLIALPVVAQPPGVVFIKNNRVGIGVSDPLYKMHLVETAAGNTTMIRMAANGAPFLFFEDTSLNEIWGLQPNGVGDFNITRTGTGGSEFLIRKNGQVLIGPGNSVVFNLTPVGNLTISGSLTQASSRSVKDRVRAVDSREALARIADLEVLEWSYKDQGARHLGPMSEEFHAAFGLGGNDKGIAPGDMAGVALAAIQGLNQVVEEKDAEIDELRAELAELKAAVATLAAGR